MPSDRSRWAPDEPFISGAAPLYLPSRCSDVFAVLGGFGRVAPEVRNTGNALLFLMGLRVQSLYIETHFCLLRLLKGVLSSCTHLISSLLYVFRQVLFIARTIKAQSRRDHIVSSYFRAVSGTRADRVGLCESLLLCAVSVVVRVRPGEMPPRPVLLHARALPHVSSHSLPRESLD